MVVKHPRRPQIHSAYIRADVGSPLGGVIQAEIALLAGRVPLGVADEHLHCVRGSKFATVIFFAA